MSVDGCIDLATLNEEEKKRFREKYDVFFFDLDGTLQTLDSEPIPGVAEGIQALSEHGKHLRVFTDSCHYTRESLGKYLKQKFPQIKEENVVTAPWFIAQYLKKIGFNRKMYVIGQPEGIVKEMKDAGFQVLSDDEVKRYTFKDIFKLQLEPGVGAVIVGADLNYSYAKIYKAVNYLKDPNTLFFVSHHMTVGHNNPLVPAAGSFALPIQKVANREPPKTFSKASPGSVEFIHSFGFEMKKCLFIGDGIDNDIACGKLCGMDTVLVLSGMYKMENLKEEIQRGDTDRIPTYYADSVALFADIFKK